MSWHLHSIAAVDTGTYTVVLRGLDATDRAYTFFVEDVHVGGHTLPTTQSPDFMNDSMPNQAAAAHVFKAVHAFHEARRDALDLTGH